VLTSTGVQLLPSGHDDDRTCDDRRTATVLVPGGLMIVLDTTITIVAIPRIVEDLHSTLPTVQWITTGQVLALRGPTHRGMGDAPLRGRWRPGWWPGSRRAGSCCSAS